MRKVHREYIVLEHIETKNNRVIYRYIVSDKLKPFFCESTEYFIDYQNNGEPIPLESVPEGVLAIPFVTNILPIIWLKDAELIIPELDKDFYESIAEFKRGFVGMYPDADFRGAVTTKILTENRTQKKGKSGMFFSGGLDAWCTLVRHMEERPMLVLLWGSDIPYTERNGWMTLREQVADTAEQLELDLVTVRSTFRKVINEGKLHKEFLPILHDGWWHGVQHGIGIIGHAAPLSYQFSIQTQYIAASFSPEDRVTCASHPSIDNFVRFCGCDVVHDAYITRPEKTKIVVDFKKKTEKKINIHVCWQSTNGKNCCHCEKCYRTIMGLFVEGENPEDYGFTINETTFLDMKKCMEQFDYTETPYVLSYWEALKEIEKHNASFLKEKPYYKKIKWIVDL